MRNYNSIKEVEKSRVGEFTIPLYNSYCFSNIFGSIKSIFNIKAEKELPRDVFGDKEIESNKVVFFLVDAFGWSFYERYKNKSKALKIFEEEGVVSKITSQFPSTTTAHVTTALTGMPVYEHGLYEWFYYEPAADDIITAFLYKSARKKELGSLEETVKSPHDFIPRENYFEALAKYGVKNKIYQPSCINGSIYTKTTTKGATLNGYEDYSDLFDNLQKDLIANSDKEYYYVYLPEIDAVAHEKGNDTKEFDDIMIKFLNYMEEFINRGKEVFKDTTIIITADHGQINTDLNDKNYLNIDMPEIEEYIVKNSKGELMCPAGYCRDLFLHVKEEPLEKVKALIKDKYSEKVEVFTFDELLSLGLFGESSKRLKERVGNLIVLPKGENNIWWYEEGVFDTSLRGVHGGASKEEMEIPLIVYKFD
ncbi:MAG: alkaline phosphatase family protein [Clostridium sp.]